MIGNLTLNRVYLAGAMDRVPDGGVQWREWITPWLNEHGIIVLNPVNKPCDIGVENAETRKLRHDAKMKGDLAPLLKDREVRAVDLRMVDISDFLIVHLDMESHPCGTYEEGFWANREKKPILVVCKQGKLHAPDWLFWAIPHEMIFSNWDELKTYIDYIHTTNKTDIDRKKRWIFFDLVEPTKAAMNAVGV